MISSPTSLILRSDTLDVKKGFSSRQTCTPIDNSTIALYSPPEAPQGEGGRAYLAARDLAVTVGVQGVL
jgi:hypothetical protein